MFRSMHPAAFVAVFILAFARIPVAHEPIAEGPFSEVSESFLFLLATLFGVLFLLTIKGVGARLGAFPKFSITLGKKAVEDLLPFLTFLGMTFIATGIVGVGTVAVLGLAESHLVLPLICLNGGFGMIAAVFLASLLVKSKHSEYDI